MFKEGKVPKNLKKNKRLADIRDAGAGYMRNDYNDIKELFRNKSCAFVQFFLGKKYHCFYAVEVTNLQ